MSAPAITGRRLAELISTRPGGASGTARYVEVAEAIRLLAVDGRVVVGTRMPSERELTAALGTSRTTITRAYDRLRESGHLTSRRGSGTVLRLPGTTRVGASGHGPMMPALPEQLTDLTFAAMPADDRVAGALEAALAEMPAHLAAPGVHRLGLPVLRHAVADRYTRRGLPTTEAQIIVTTGAVAGMSAVAHALLGPGDRVLLEQPTYPGSLELVRRVGARPVPWAVPEDGTMDVADLTSTLRQAAPRMALLTPDFHNPTGRYLSAADRERVATALTGAGVVTLVDETLLDVALDPTHVAAPPFAACGAGAVFTVGSASKSYWNGLRVGWIRAPREDVGRVLQARAGLDLGAPVLEQLAVARLVSDDSPGSGPVLARARRDHLVGEVSAHLPDWSFQIPTGGHTLWCRLPVEASSALVERCAAAGVLLAPGSAFSADGRGLDRFVRLPYTPDEATLSAAVTVIGQAWAHLRDRPHRRSPERIVVT